MRVELESGGVWSARPEAVTLTAEWFAAAALGGPERAEVRVAGPAAAVEEIAGWLGRGVTIRNEAGTAVWGGFVHEVRIEQNGRTVGASLAEMANRVQVIYTLDAPDGSSAAAETEWASDSDSIFRYGQIERRLSAGSDLKPDEATQMRNAELARRKTPALYLAGGASSAAAGSAGGLLVCVGWWQRLERRYYTRLTGRVEFEEDAENGGDAVHAVGWRLVSNQVGFYKQWLYHLGAQLGELREGDSIVISGAGSNNGTRTVAKTASEDVVSVANTTIYFEASDDIRDPGAGMGDLRAPGMIHITGGGSNNGYRLIESASPRYLNVDGAFGGIVDYTPSGTVTIAEGHQIETTPWAGATAAPGATVTIEKHSTIGQAWRMPAGESWRLGSIALRVRRVGSPASGLVVEVKASSGGAPSGAALASATLTNAPEGLTWVRLDFDHSWAPTANTVYWIVVSTASYAPDAFYELELNAATLAPEGQALVWNGSAWVALAAPASLPFKVWGGVDATVLLRDILSAHGLFTFVDVQAVGGVYRHPYAGGELTARAAAEKVMGLGTAGGARLAAWVDEQRAVVVRSAAAATGTSLRWDAQNRLVGAGGREVEPGLLPVGQFVWVDGLPRVLEEFGASVFVERAQFDVRSGRLVLTPAAVLDPLAGGAFELG
jgi:hypothetical protein